MSEWKNSLLGELTNVIMGQSPPSSTYNSEGLGVPFLQGCADFGVHYPLTKIYCSKPQKIAPKDSLLISVRAPVGDTNRANTDYAIGRGLAALVATNIDSNLLEYIVQHQMSELERVSQGSTFLAINTDDLKNLRLFTPSSVIEQRKIARILSTVNAVIEKTEAVIAKYKAIKQGMMHDLFTRGLHKNGKLRPRYQDAPELYKKTESGWIPKEWEIEPLINFTTQIGDGMHATPKYSTNTDYYFINGNNLWDGEIFIPLGCPCISKQEYSKYFKELNSRTILYSINGTIGNIALYNFERVILGKSICYISCNKKIDLDYLYYFLQTEPSIKFFENELTSSTIKNLSLASIRNTPIAYSRNNNEQNEIAKRISSISKYIKAEESLLIKQQKVKQGLMSILLTGKARVKYEEEKNYAME